MEAFWQSLLLVTVSEIGDKTQLLALVLVLRFGRPWTIMLGILVATLLNHGLAASVGSYVAAKLTPETLRTVLSVSFAAFAVWVLIPDKDDSEVKTPKFGVFLTTTILFFFAEMGDKTQLATVGLAARFQATVAVTAGTTAGMLIADGLAVFFGREMTERLPLKYFRWIASGLFLLFAAAVWLFPEG